MCYRTSYVIVVYLVLICSATWTVAEPTDELARAANGPANTAAATRTMCFYCFINLFFGRRLCRY